MHFVEGLRDDIHNAAVATYIRIACVLALLQEELVVPSRKRDLKKLEALSFSRTGSRSPPPFLLPLNNDKQSVPAPALDDRRGCGVEDMLCTLHVYQRACGLYI